MKINLILYFLTKNAKYKAIVEDVKERHEKGQPVLIGTIAIETSELLSDVLTSNGIPHEVLNAKQHEREAEIVAHAGEPGHVTIATNMAGRGTDIKLTPESVELRAAYIFLVLSGMKVDVLIISCVADLAVKAILVNPVFIFHLKMILIRIFAGDTLKKNMERFGMTEDETIESAFVSKTIERAQEKVEKHNFDIRKHLLEYDDVLNQQRIVIYSISPRYS